MEYLLLTIICLPLVGIGIQSIVHAFFIRNVSSRGRREIVFKNPFVSPMKPQAENHFTADILSHQDKTTSKERNHTQPRDTSLNLVPLFH